MSDGGIVEGQRGGQGPGTDRTPSIFTPGKKRQLREQSQRDGWIVDRETRAVRRNAQLAKRRPQKVEDSGEALQQEPPQEDERSMAHEEALHMDRLITGVFETSAVLRNLRKLKFRKLNRGLMRQAKDLVSQRPEFRLMGEPGFLLNDIHDALERDSFGPASELIGQIKDNTKLSYRDRRDVDEGVDNLIRERARALVADGDGKHFVAIVAFLGEHLRRGGLPEDTLKVEAIKNALKEHAISVFQEHYNDFKTVGLKLGPFHKLGLVNKKDLINMPEIRDFVGPRLVADFEAGRDDFVNHWELYKEGFNNKSQTFKAIQERVPERVEKMFGEVEGDSRELLIKLSNFIKFGFISENQVREMPVTFKRVQDALSSLDSDGGDDSFDPDNEKALTYIRAKFGKKK